MQKASEVRGSAGTEAESGRSLAPAWPSVEPGGRSDI